MADKAALAGPETQGTVRDRLFYMLMQRLDVMQEHRAGVIALLRHLPFDPPLALMLKLATDRSMRWMLETAGVRTRGLRGELRVRALSGLWIWTMRAWERDETSDMSATMRVLDTALARAERLAGWFGGGPRPEFSAEEAGAPAADEMPPEPESPPPPELGPV